MQIALVNVYDFGHIISTMDAYDYSRRDIEEYYTMHVFTETLATFHLKSKSSRIKNYKNIN